MLSRRVLPLTVATLLLASIIGVTSAMAQTEACEPGTPLLGTSGPEVCVKIMTHQPTPSIVYFRSAASAGALVTPMTTVGNHRVQITVNYTFDSTSMTITIEGTITKTSPDPGEISMIATGGWGTQLLNTHGCLFLNGSRTNTSKLVFAGNSGQPRGTVPTQDTTYQAFQDVVDIGTPGPNTFTGERFNQRTVNQVVAVSAFIQASIVDVGTTMTIGSGSGVAIVPSSVACTSVGNNGRLGGSTSLDLNKLHFECYSVDHHPEPREDIIVSLSDQFAEVKTRLGDITRICTPVDKNREGMLDPELHLVCYEILDPHVPDLPVLTSNQFGESQLQVRVARELCVPSNKQRLTETESDSKQEEQPKKTEENKK